MFEYSYTLLTQNTQAFFVSQTRRRRKNQDVGESFCNYLVWTKNKILSGYQQTRDYYMSKWAHGKFFWNREKVHTWKRAAAAVQAFYFLAVWHETSNERPCHCRRWSSSCTSRRWTSRHGTGTKVEDQMVRRGLKEKFEIKTRQNRCMLTLFSGVPVSWGKVCRVLRPLPNH